MAMDYFMYIFSQKEKEFAVVATCVLLLDNKHQWGTVVFTYCFVCDHWKSLLYCSVSLEGHSWQKYLCHPVGRSINSD